MKAPKTLNQGDLISILAPAKSIDTSFVEYAKIVLEERGFKVVISTNCLGRHHYYSGTDEERLVDFQSALDNPEVKAILCARGGYGSIRIFDTLDWDGFKMHPKWILGFSDITVFHHIIHSFGIQSIHSSMPLNFKENTTEALDTLFSAVKGTLFNVMTVSSRRNVTGTAKGELVGGNLSIIYSLLSSKYSYDFTNKILFIEDLSEQYYHIDRMMHALKEAGAFNKLKGLIVGGMTELRDTEVSFGMDAPDIILSQVSHLNIPVCFDFPCGHIDDNRAMILGSEVLFQVSDSLVELAYV